MWAGGPVRAALHIGIPAGFGFGLLQFAIDGSVAGAVFGGVFFAVFFGGTMALIARRRWSGSGRLAPDDRVAVARAVRRGDDVGDDRLVEAVIDYAEAVRKTQERDARLRWILPLFGVLSFVIAVTSTIGGSAREAVVFWLLSGFWVIGILWWFPRQRARWRENASRAEAAARRRAGDP